MMRRRGARIRGTDTLEAKSRLAHTVLCRRSGSGEEICTIVSVSPDITLKTEYVSNASNVIEDDQT